MPTLSLFDPALAAYNLVPPVEPFELSGAGLNNEVMGVRSGAGTFIWKTYAADIRLPALEYMHRLLAWLSGQGLSFAVPAPLPTRAGDVLCHTPEGLKALFVQIPGTRPDDGDPHQIEAVGAGLGELHTALQRLPLEWPPGMYGYGELDKVHPGLPDPAGLTVEMLGLPARADTEDLLAWWRQEMVALQDFLSQTYRSLPCQITHGDFVAANTLHDGTRLTGVLDFDFAMPNARALDVAMGLEFSMRMWENPAPWEAGQAFCRGYRRWVQLDRSEVAAIPQLILLRDAVSAIWWLGRSRTQGDASPNLDRIGHLRDRVRWLADNRPRLLEMTSILSAD